MSLAPLRLLLFIHDLAPFGAQRVALNTVRLLDKGRFSAVVCSFGTDETLAAEFRAAGAEVLCLGARRYLDLRAWRCLAAWLSASRPDLVQTNLPELSVPVRLLALFLPGVRVIHAVHNPLSSEPWYWRLLNLATLPLCRRVVFCSQSMRDTEPAARLLALGRGRVVRNGVERAAGPAARGLRGVLGIGPGEKVICCIARLSRQKGQDVLIRALAMLLARGRAVRLLLAGDGEDRERLEALAAGSGAAGKVIFLGRRPDAGSILSACDIYAAPSRWEGFGLSLGEAMLAGLPCVATGIPGHADLLTDGVTGLAVPPGDAAALAAGIDRLIDDPDASSRLAAAGREFVRKELGVESMAGGYEAVYLEAAGRGS